MKKIIISFLMVISFILLYFCWKLDDRYCMAVEIKSSENLQTILAGKTLVNNVPESVMNDNHLVFYDKNTSTIFVTQSIDAKKPGGVLSATEGTLYFEENDMLTKLPMALEKAQRFELYQVFTDTYCKYNLLFTGLPIMKMTVEDTYQREINFMDKTVSTAEIELADPYRKEASYQNTKGEFYRRGKTSYEHDYSKKNYKLTLTDEKLSLCGMRKDDDWILNGLLDDGGMVHHKSGYELWNEVAEQKEDQKEYSTNLEYIDLFVDNEYYGTYGLIERIDEKELQLSENDKLYKVRSPREMEAHNFTNDMTDGVRPIAALKYPKNPTEEDWNPLRQWSDCFHHGWIDSIEDAYALLDYENALDYNIFCLLLWAEDNKSQNSYLIAVYDESLGKYRMKRIPWDLNLTFGTILTETPETNWIEWKDDLITDTSVWTPEISFLYARDDVRVARDLYLRWVELRQSVYTRENIYKIFDEQYGYLKKTGAYLHNYQWFPYDTE